MPSRFQRGRKERRTEGGREEGEYIHIFLDNIFYSYYMLQWCVGYIGSISPVSFLIFKNVAARKHNIVYIAHILLLLYHSSPSPALTRPHLPLLAPWFPCRHMPAETGQVWLAVSRSCSPQIPAWLSHFIQLNLCSEVTSSGRRFLTIPSKPIHALLSVLDLPCFLHTAL